MSGLTPSPLICVKKGVHRVEDHSAEVMHAETVKAGGVATGLSKRVM